MLPSRTQGLTREQIAAAVGNNPRAIKLFEALLSDVSAAIPAALAAQSLQITDLQEVDADLTARVGVLEGELEGHAIEDEGLPMAQRLVLNFVGAGVTVADLGDKTVVTIPGGGSGGGTVLGSGTSVLDFGASGAPMATVTVTGQTALLAGSLVYCWIKPEATTDHSEHEHIVESIKVVAADIVAGVGFTIWGLCPDPAIAPAGPDLAIRGRFSGDGTAPGAGQAARGNPNPLNRTALLKGKWTVGWFYTQ